MGKYFSVAWLAQSHNSSPDCADPNPNQTLQTPNRPHIPCMVQPSPPTFGQCCLQLKPSSKTENMEIGEDRSSCPSSPESKNSDYSSGEESKLEPKADRDTQRRVRTKFSTEQLSKLERIFNKHRYLDVVRRVKTAKKLDLTETQVRTWFQNRRMKMKREMQDNVASPVPPETFRRLVPVQYGVMAGLPSQYSTFDRSFYYPLPQLAHQPLMPPHFMSHHHPHFCSITAA